MYALWVDRFNRHLNKDLLQITLEDVAAFTQRINVFYAPKNVQYGLSIIHDYLHFLIDSEGLKFPLHLFKVRAQRANTHHTILEDEHLTLLKNLPTNEPYTLKLHIMLRILWETGIRVGELCSIKLEDLYEGGALIRNEKNIHNRPIWWSKETDRLLKYYLPLRVEMTTKEPHVFVSFYRAYMGKRLSTRQVERCLAKVVGECGVNPRIVPHSYRHAFIHRKLLEGQPNAIIQRMVGHITDHTISNYARLSSKELKEAWLVIHRN